jgi:hypothetical protein
MYKDDEIKLILSTDCISRSVYILENGGPTDAYRSQDNAYEIPEVLWARYENTEQWGLTTLTEKFNKVVRSNFYACLDVWFDSRQYFKELMVRAGGSAKKRC